MQHLVLSDILFIQIDFSLKSGYSGTELHKTAKTQFGQTDTTEIFSFKSG